MQSLYRVRVRVYPRGAAPTFRASSNGTILICVFSSSSTASISGIRLFRIYPARKSLASPNRTVAFASGKISGCTYPASSTRNKSRPHDGAPIPRASPSIIIILYVTLGIGQFFLWDPIWFHILLHFSCYHIHKEAPPCAQFAQVVNHEARQ